MKNLIGSILVLVSFTFFTGCKIPQTIIDADNLSTRLQLKYSGNTDDFVLAAIRAYVEEARAAIKFRAQVARRNGTLEEEITKFEASRNAAVDSGAARAIRKYKEIRGDLSKALRLRLKISKYLGSKASAEDLLKEFGDTNE